MLKRYLVTEFLKVFALTAFSFLAIVMTTRLEEIAQFATLGASFVTTLKFTLLQLPYILPIVIPIASLIAAIVLFQRLSSDQELTALRASGFSVRRIAAPILMASGILALINFYLISEFATYSQMTTRSLRKELTHINPLTLTQNKQILKNRDIHIASKSHTLTQDHFEEFLLAYWNRTTKHIALFTAQELDYKNGSLEASGTTLMSPVGNHIYIENVQKNVMDVAGITTLIAPTQAKFKIDHYPLCALLAYVQKTKSARAISEIFRRFSIAAATVTFTLLGIAFAIQTGRERDRKRIYMIVGLASLYLICFFAARATEKHAALAATLYTLPNILILIASIASLKQISRGRA